MISSFRKAFVVILGCCLLMSLSAHAQSRESERIRILESKVRQFEGLIYDLNQRVSNLEYRGPVPPPPPVPVLQVSCMITDNAYGKVFLGKGRTKLEAEARAKESCGQSVNAAYCNTNLKCNDFEKERGTQDAICVVTDTAYGKTFKGEGRSLIEAEFNARKTCGGTVNPAYCNSTIRCEIL